MEIKINDKVYKLKYTLRALFIYEQLTGKMFELRTLTDEYVFFYCIIMANNKDVQLTFNDFIEALDGDPSIMKKYKEFVQTEISKLNLFEKEEVVSDKKKF